MINIYGINEKRYVREMWADLCKKVYSDSGKAPADTIGKFSRIMGLYANGTLSDVETCNALLTTYNDFYYQL